MTIERFQMFYKADIAGVTLKPQESRIIAGWLLGRTGVVNEETWQKLIYKDNEVQIRGRSTLRRQSNLIRARLRLMSPDMLTLITDGNFRETIQACFAAAIKHSRLLGDFLDIVIRGELRHKNRQLSSYHWRQYLDDCRSRDHEMTQWAPSTSSRIKTAVFTILQEAGVLKREGDYIVQKSEYEKKVLQQLQIDNESYILRCMRYET